LDPDQRPSSPLAARLANVRARIDAACARAGRDPADVTLVAVTKSVDAARAAELARLGVRDLGENRTESLAGKREALAAAGLSVRWHMIGHLQTNKVRRALPAIDVLHSLDRTSLMETLRTELARADGPPLPAFVQVNVAGEQSKGGFDETGLWQALDAARSVPRLEVRGLMTMAPVSGRAEDARPVFRRLRELRDAARFRGYLLALDLSMGMSQDFEIAVEEGATHVRVGTILYSG
jgi:pyridoxal phosphate enzyme (YggS family)